MALLGRGAIAANWPDFDLRRRVKSAASRFVIVGCLMSMGIVGCSSAVHGSGTAASAVGALPSNDVLPSPSTFISDGAVPSGGNAPSGGALPSGGTVPSGDVQPGGTVPSGAAQPGGGTGSNTAQPGSAPQPPVTLPHTVAVTTAAATHKPTTAPAAPAAPAFVSLVLSTGTPACGSATGGPTEPELLTWRVSNATGIAVAIDDVNFADATRYAGASGTQELTNIQCTGSVKYTFDVWTTSSSGSAGAHRQLQVTGPSGAPPVTPPSFQQLTLQTGSPGCAPQAGRTTVPELVNWRVANATGIAVGIDDPNLADATQYSGVSGSQEVTSIACNGSVRYTFDIWTIGGSGGAPAHRQLSVTGPA